MKMVMMEDNSSSKYVVVFDGLSIETIITHKANIVEEWIQQISSKEDMIIGLDTEWTKDKNKKTKVAILQLCVEDKCLIFQFFFNNIVPQCLRSFLMDPNFKFVGVGIENDIKRLKSDYGLECKNGIDLATFAGEKCDQNYSSRGLKFLAKELVGLDMKKSKDICTSEWKSKELTKDQIEYACIDAYASYKIGHYLLLQKEEVYPKPI
ncbi:Werner Syndrome-like exonuclease [Arachis ipaensis]|uniref:Werner Syndrome-like exonuclease n=1 Tax=Arachis ipaensis TaxID=130454 RepID=UPI000A2B6A38|nr:Werner Syndrome-like exonuclease [Arachis ipaensis]